MASSVVSADGTVIGYETLGSGPPMLLVHGGTATKLRWAPVQERLAERYTLHMMDRRGRGLSTAEAEAYDIQREGEDVAAVLAAIGEGVYVVGHSFGGLCTLEAALITDRIGRIVLYEPPMRTPGLHVVPSGALAALRAMTDPSEVLETFYREALELPQAAIDGMKGTEMWHARVAAAFTIVRELDQVEAFTATERLAKITVPVRMLLGTESTTFIRAATAACASQIPGTTIVALQGQAHQAIDSDPDQFVTKVFAFGE
jgi:pimeloyl-ACP methyl ester carboxylesterase